MEVIAESSKRLLESEPDINIPDTAAEFLAEIDAAISDRMTCWRSEMVSRRNGSSIEGQGLFAVEDIAPGTLIGIKPGRLLNRQTIKDNADVIQGSHQQIDEDIFLAGITREEVDKNLIGYNHSCDSNARVVLFKGVPLSFLVTDKHISKGEEVTADYSLSQASNTHMLARCKCGSPQCRGYVAPAYDWTSEEFQKDHEGDFVWYIRDKIKERQGLSPQMRQARENVELGIKSSEVVVLLYDEISQLESEKNNAMAGFPKRFVAMAEKVLTRGGYYGALDIKRQELINAVMIFCTHTPITLVSCGIDTSSLEGALEEQEQLQRFQQLIEANIENIVKKARVFSKAMTA